MNARCVRDSKVGGEGTHDERTRCAAIVAVVGLDILISTRMCSRTEEL
jgi:hypothetical protein